MGWNKTTNKKHRKNLNLNLFQSLFYVIKISKQQNIRFPLINLVIDQYHLDCSRNQPAEGSALDNYSPWTVTVDRSTTFYFHKKINIF